MRQLVFDKIQYADLVVFNRFRDEYDREAFHKIVRGVSRRPDIVYEYAGGRAVYDDIEDPLPYDIDAPVVTIEDRDYAFFYRDLMEDMQKYAGKTVRFKGLVATDKRLKPGTIVVGRHIMTCCEADMTFLGFMCRWPGAENFRTKDWVTVRAKIGIEYQKDYHGEGPVLYGEQVKTAKEIKEVVQF